MRAWIRELENMPHLSEKGVTVGRLLYHDMSHDLPFRIDDDEHLVAPWR